MNAASSRHLQRRLQLAFGVIVTVCTLALLYYVAQARQHVGADYTAMVTDVVRAQQDPVQLRQALESLVDGAAPPPLERLEALLWRIPRRIESLRRQLHRSDLAAEDYASLLEELERAADRLPVLEATVARWGQNAPEARSTEALLAQGLAVESDLAWAYSELNERLHQASADQRRLMERLTLAVGMLLALLVFAVGAVMLMLLRLHQQREAMRHQSRVDALTGLANRRRLQEAAEEAFARRQRHPSPLGLILLDLDHFKTINDAYGHPVGDGVLASFAATLQHQVRRGDIVARMGGEEFAILMPESDLEAGRLLAERIRLATRAMRLSGQAAGHRLTVSIGVAEAWDDEGFDGLYRRADQGLYHAKARGRDRIEAASTPRLSQAAKS
ncbi:diguanylate cyclase [Halomonas cerina]|uniref:diguanylate cyclase n=1 Tax=Halomonas cerina TaxID=447424 RepID=A0A839V8J7_9GAMM|nr:diguanylate cyclase (GGDEF)-like protein [Halomonas cerina]